MIEAIVSIFIIAAILKFIWSILSLPYRLIKEAKKAFLNRTIYRWCLEVGMIYESLDIKVFFVYLELGNSW